MKPEWAFMINVEATKQLNVGFLKVVKYLTRLTSIVPILKKDEIVTMCVNYKDHNKSFPKDDFPHLQIDVLVENTNSRALLSFMNGVFNYN